MTISDALTDDHLLFEWTFKQQSDIDAFMNKEEFLIRVLSTPRKEDEQSGLENYIFMGRIVDPSVPSPHEKMLDDPCEISTASPEGVSHITWLNSLHTRFRFNKISNPQPIEIGDFVFARLEAGFGQRGGTYNLQIAQMERLDVKAATPTSATSRPECPDLSSLNYAMPMGAYTGASGTPARTAIGSAARATALAAGVPTGDIGEFYSDIIRAMGGTLNDELLKFFGAWGNLEQPRTTNNPLATTWPQIGKCTWAGDPGMTTFNTIHGTCGVKNYSTYEAGVQATVNTLNGGGGKYYEHIVLFIQGKLTDSDGKLVTQAIDALSMGEISVELDRWGSKGHKVLSRLSQGKTDNPNTLITAKGATTAPS